MLKKSNKRKNHRKGNKTRNINLLLGLAAALIVTIAVYWSYSHEGEEGGTLSIQILALMAGTIVESYRYSEKWTTILLSFVSALILGFIAVFPISNHHDAYAENPLALYPYVFMGMFTCLSIFIHGKMKVKPLGEGTTLLLSFAIIYWVADYGYINADSTIEKSVLILGLLLSLYTLLHAFSRLPLSRLARTVLSIWSSVIMLVFAYDNLSMVFKNQQIIDLTNMSEGFYISLQFFLLGASSAYIVSNFILLIGFLPTKNDFFNASYFHRVKEFQNKHISRYSKKQVLVVHSLVCVFFCCTLFGLNYYFKLIPRHLAIWIVFISFPYALMLFDFIIKKRS